jgi:hypothetical protein
VHPKVTETCYDLAEDKAAHDWNFVSLLTKPAQCFCYWPSRCGRNLFPFKYVIEYGEAGKN